MKFQKIIFILTIYWLAAVLGGCLPSTKASSSTSGIVSGEICYTSGDPPSFLNSIRFPRQEPKDGPSMVMEAELVGELMLVNDCLRIKSVFNGESYLPVWPPGFSSGDDEGEIVICDNEGHIVGRVGREIFMGGGEVSGDRLEQYLEPAALDTCEGPYWIVGQGVRLNIPDHPTLVDLSVIEYQEGRLVLPLQNEGLIKWVKTTRLSTFGGILSASTSATCPRLRSESGLQDYAVIWPAGYQLQVVQGEIQILNKGGNVVAKEGDKLVLVGEILAPSRHNDLYEKLVDQLPGDCWQPFFVVGGNRNQ